MPRDQNLPVNQKTGAPLYLLAQINFEQIPHIKDFPEKGLLQIFISGDDGVYGLDFDNEYSQSGWCLRYLEEVILNYDLYYDLNKSEMIDDNYENCSKIKRKLINKIKFLIR